jgi:hypothetical protein
MILTMGCKKEAEVIPTIDYSLDDSGCSWDYSKIEQDTVYIINSNVDLKKYITGGSNIPEIDFAKNTLLFAQITARSGIGNLSIKLVKSGNDYTLDITVILDDATYGMKNISIIVNKLDTNNIKLSVTQIKN